jgi:hypothetical protein
MASHRRRHYYLNNDFDIVPHSSLRHKLNISEQFSVMLISFIANWQTDCCSVCISSTLSSSYIMKSGFMHESTLGPLLIFSLMIFVIQLTIPMISCLWMIIRYITVLRILRNVNFWSLIWTLCKSDVWIILCN